MIIYSVWAVVVFPTIVGFPRYILCLDIAYCFLHFDWVHTSKVRLWPNELVDLFLSRFGSDKPQLDGFTDSDMSADVDTNRSTSGYVMTYAGGAVSWQSRLQKTVALSTTEAEYMAARKYYG